MLGSLRAPLPGGALCSAAPPPCCLQSKQGSRPHDASPARIPPPCSSPVASWGVEHQKRGGGSALTERKRLAWCQAAVQSATVARGPQRGAPPECADCVGPCGRVSLHRAGLLQKVPLPPPRTSAVHCLCAWLGSPSPCAPLVRLPACHGRARMVGGRAPLWSQSMAPGELRPTLGQSSQPCGDLWHGKGSSPVRLCKLTPRWWWSPLGSPPLAHP